METSNETPQSQEAFERGLAAAGAGRYEQATRYFRDAAEAGNANWRESQNLNYRPHLRSRRPEVWFNLALAQSRLPGYELQALASFQAFLLMQPETPTADAVRRQMRTLEATIDDNVRVALARFEGAIQPHIARPILSVPFSEQIAIDESRRAGAEIYATRVLLGDRGHGDAIFARFMGPDWRSQSDVDGMEIAMWGAASDPAEWARYAPLWRDRGERFTYFIEARDLASAERELPKMTVYGDSAEFERESDWMMLACAAREQGDARAEAAALNAVRALGARYQRDREYQLQSRIVFLIALGDRERAAAIMPPDAGPAYTQARDLLAGRQAPRWCGSRLQTLQGYAVDPETLAQRLTRGLQGANNNPRGAIQELSYYAHRYREIHGPFH